MSQSKSSYGVQGPKDSAHTRNEEKDTDQHACAQSRETVEPACQARAVGRGIDRREWREIPYNGPIGAFYDPCKWCYPNGPPDESVTETVVRSCREPTTYHRHRHRNGSESNADEHDTDDPEPPTGDTRISIEPIESTTDLRVGEWAELRDWDHPLHVVTTETEGMVGLRGPNGGEYQIEDRPECPQPYYSPEIGYLSKIVRVRVEIPLTAV